MNRLSAFFRSVIPEDFFQLIFLVGVVSLNLSRRLGWFPTVLIQQHASGLGSWNLAQQHAWSIWLQGAIYIIVLASLVGYFVCFWPGRHPLRRLLLAVCLPSFAGLVLVFGLYVWILSPGRSVLDSNFSFFHQIVQIASWFSEFPLGFKVCMFGISLILVFAVRLGLGESKLPLALSSATVVEDSELWPSSKILTYIFVGPFFLIAAFPLSILLALSWEAASLWTSRLVGLTEATLAIAVAMTFAGKRIRQTVADFLRLPSPWFLVLAFVIPIFASGLIPLGQYIFDRAHWAAFDFGKTVPPQLVSYFEITKPWLFLTIFSSFAEEFVVRGMLQPIFVKRYGVFRGIFLVGLIWGVEHFATDTYSHLPLLEIVWKLIFRIVICIVLSYVFGWMMLKSSSILPSGIAHTLFNLFAFGGTDYSYSGKSELRMVLWGVVAIVLFSQWPVTDIDSPRPTEEIENMDPNPNPAI